MVATMTSTIVAVRFNKIGKLYHFDVGKFPELEPGHFVIVETARGRQLGQIVGFVSPENAHSKHIKHVKAPATARDLMMNKLWEAKNIEALITCREMAAKLGTFDGVKFIQADYNYDGSMLAINYTSEETMINTTKLRQRLEGKYHTRIELRRVGTRDAAKVLGEYGACGGPRCCSTFLSEFSPISIKMAKAQGISLNPSEITGMCGRLRCCLIYEYEQYVEANKTLPRAGKWIGTPYGEGKVIDVNSLRGTVTVIVNDTRQEIGRDDIVPLEELRALQKKAAQSCSKEGAGGVCECGARVRSEGDKQDEQPQAEQQHRSGSKQKSSGKSRRRGGKRSSRRRSRSRQSGSKGSQDRKPKNQGQKK